MARIQKIRSLTFKYLNFIKNRQKSQFCFLEKGVLELCWAATVEPSGPQQANSSLQTSLETVGCSVAEIS